MDLPCLKWQKHVEEKWTKLSRDEKTGWSRMADIDELFEFALSQINQEDLLFLSGISEDYPVQKDSAHASRCRERGNASFKARLYTAAALHYSQGVCHASRSSEQLSLCYANRSAALLHLQLYQESLEDVDRALQHGYPAHLHDKLLQRRALCLRLRPQAPDPPCPRPAGQHTGGRGTGEEGGQPNQHVSPLCPGVSVRFSPGKGRHLVAAEGKAAGDVVLQDRAYSCVLVPGMGGVTETERERGSERGQREFGTEERRCHRCLRETLSPVPCEGCSHARYCSEGCRGAAWTEHHRWECPIGAQLRATGVMSQLALRVALKAGLKDVRRATQPIRDESSLSKPITKEEYPEAGVTASADGDGGGDPSACYHGDSYLSVYHLLPHLSCHAPSLRYLCAVTIATLYRKLTGAGPPPASWDVTGSGSRKCPGQSQEPEDEGSAVGWAPELSLLGGVVLRHMLQLRCNAQAVSALTDTGERDAAVRSNKEVRIATAIFPTLSVLNHSCRPNTSLSFSPGAGLEPGAGRDPGPPEPVCPAGVRSPVCGVTVTVRAARTIAPGQEILHCYGPHSSRLGAGRRRGLLMEQYFFLCECEACGPEGRGEGADTGLLCGTCSEPLKGGAEGWCVCPCGQRLSHDELVCRLKEVRAQLEQAAQLTERDQPDQALRVLRRAGSQAARFLRETHPLQGQLADAMARAHATMGDWQAAASQLDRSAMAVAFQYGEDSVELGRQLFKLAQLHFNGHAPGPALSALLRARKLLSLHCDARCPELQELQAMERCLREEL